MKVVCSIGTTDPYHAAGLGLDLHVLSELGVRPVTVVAGISAQDAGGVRALAAVGPELIEAQFVALAAAEVAAYRIGALLDEPSVAIIAACLEPGRLPVVYDPVALASAGGAFADKTLLQRIAHRLLPLATIITPNLIEASMITGSSIENVEEMIRAAKEMTALGARAVLLKGGHLEGAPQDVFVTQGQVDVFTDERLPYEMRGTGCVLAASLAAALAQGATLYDAVKYSRAFVRRKIGSAREFGTMRLAY